MTPEEFVRNAERLIGMSYSECDCIGVVRRAAGIRCQGTNWLWRSYESSGKYQYLIDRFSTAVPADEAPTGLLVFRIKWNEVPRGYNDRPNCHHVGIIDGKDVIQSQESKGVYRKRYVPSEWQGAGWLKFIDYHQIGLPFTDESTVEDEQDYGNRQGQSYPSCYEMVKALYDKFIID